VFSFLSILSYIQYLFKINLSRLFFIIVSVITSIKLFIRFIKEKNMTLYLEITSRMVASSCISNLTHLSHGESITCNSISSCLFHRFFEKTSESFYFICRYSRSSCQLLLYRKLMLTNGLKKMKHNSNLLFVIN
jgi:hypothetical protein